MHEFILFEKCVQNKQSEQLRVIFFQNPLTTYLKSCIIIVVRVIHIYFELLSLVLLSPFFCSIFLYFLFNPEFLTPVIFLYCLWYASIDTSLHILLY